MVDVNGFKSINDTFGHRTGDRFLQQTAALLQKQIRKNDLAIRYGGDEFLLLLPGCDYKQTVEVVQRLRAETAAWNKKQDAGNPELALAIGLAAGPVTELDELIRTADRAMYRDKPFFHGYAPGSNNLTIPDTLYHFLLSGLPMTRLYTSMEIFPGVTGGPRPRESHPDGKTALDGRRTRTFGKLRGFPSCVDRQGKGLLGPASRDLLDAAYRFVRYRLTGSPIR
ncbi:GGDEF domain-containing protein [Moorella sp. Hama-1]|uniref:GGDEF domain-containing protein n=1 Tax=Moorella sp. Hama-1 TaxID=2138101 RepID=UPI000D64BD16|nr:GGDEF domain-containing protein [Moorella sp. Hama-1]BCV22234.1 hypothetical protein hamaS1_23030 [Moorella sp. Hama-1]